MEKRFSDHFKLSYGDAPYDIHLEAWPAGGDIVASVTGGTRPHVGAVALAEPEETRHPVTGEPMGRGGGIRVSALVSEGHKDAILAEMFARGLCENYGVRVCASAGVHVDGAGEKEIALLLENAKSLLEMI